VPPAEGTQAALNLNFEDEIIDGSAVTPCWITTWWRG
jgi:hypothetical protein